MIRGKNAISLHAAAVACNDDENNGNFLSFTLVPLCRCRGRVKALNWVSISPFSLHVMLFVCAFHILLRVEWNGNGIFHRFMASKPVNFIATINTVRYHVANVSVVLFITDFVIISCDILIWPILTSWGIAGNEIVLHHDGSSLQFI